MKLYVHELGLQLGWWGGEWKILCEGRSCSALSFWQQKLLVYTCVQNTDVA
jgi:hypothetical protein